MFRSENFLQEIDANTPPSEISTHAARSWSYLCRVQYLQFRTFPDHREQTLWQALPIPEAVPFLCPNLKGLSLNLHKSTQNFTYDFSPLISPSLVEVTLVPAWRENLECSDLTASVFLSILRRHNIQLLHLSHWGFVQHRLFRLITQFSSLSSLTITGPFYNGNGYLEESHIISFQSLSRLRCLEMNMNLMREGSETAFGRWLASLDALSTLYLRGTWSQVSRSIFNGSSAFTSVRSLSLSFQSSGGDTGTDLFPNISLAFPMLHSLVVGPSLRAVKKATTIEDIMLLKGRSMERIKLWMRSITLNSADIVGLLITWPTLKEIQFGPMDGVVLEAKYVLSYASTHGAHLQNISLPLNFSSLATNISPTFSSPICPLRELDLWGAGDIPSDLEKKHTLVQNLITLFPRLTVLTGPKEIKDLQHILNAFRNILRHPPRQSDCLFHYD